MTRSVIQHRAISAQIASLQSQLAALEETSEYVRDREFVDQLDNLLNTYGKDLRSVIAIFDPQAKPSQEGRSQGSRGPRKVQKYRNPHTNEILVTAGGNNRVLKEWKKQYPNENIKDWIEGKKQ
ncbi:histone-like nucleoid-structuring protein, MvaT/MvaU family [Pseudomonas lutea]|uniref:MvaT DNA-binding domain-containing protein n=1 Tax=Pseudomonas lutea TaxID=243924 RepID=A0A9X0EA97_9PSED|nr:histone-like nucleoid-structuring protein, MvaT/MvaU family [Pseudomonas lutea]KGF62103.1 hypothetical protein LT42_25440 [Pseudomonas lutea]